MAKSIKVGRELWERIERAAKAGGYSSPQEFAEHVLDKHEIGFLPGLGAPFLESRRKLQRRTAVVLRKRRVGKDSVELANLAMVQNLRVLQRIRVFDGEARDVRRPITRSCRKKA